MTIFYIDTSSSNLYTGIYQNNSLKVSIKKNLSKDMSKYALNEIKSMFDKTNIDYKDIDKIIVVSGPGSFTGIRIGMTIAKTYAYSLGKDITSISSLDAMAYSVNTNILKVPVIDARRGYVYAGIYKNNDIIKENEYIKLDDLIKYLDSLNEEYIFITNDSKLDNLNRVKYNPDLLTIINNTKDKENINPHLIEPFYLKLTEAEENLGKL